MTDERIQTIVEALEKNEELKNRVLAMEPVAAAEKLKEEGYDFTADELVELGKLAAEARELDEEELDSVAGGYKCRNCGKKIKNTPLARAWHWLTKGCWGY